VKEYEGVNPHIPKATPTLGNERKIIWMWALWPTTEYTIRGKVVASPKFEPW